MTTTDSQQEQGFSKHSTILKPCPKFTKTMAGSIEKLLLINIALISLLLFISFTHIQKDVESLGATPYILNGLILYFILYPCIKAVTHLILFQQYKTQLMAWKTQMAETISESDHNSLILCLQKIRTMLRMYPLVILVHIAIAFTCYYLKSRFLAGY